MRDCIFVVAKVLAAPIVAQKQVDEWRKGKEE
jgi:hypothetical protein